MLFPLLVITASSSLWGMYLAYKLGRWHGERATMFAIRQERLVRFNKACVKLGGKRG